MLDFDEVMKSVRFEMFERLSSPLFTTFLFSWCVVNHQFILVFFGSGDVVTKLKIINNDIYGGFYCQFLKDIFFIKFFFSNLFLKFFILPAVFTFIFIYIYPKVSIPVYEKWRKNRNSLIDAKMKADKEEPVSKEKADELLRRIVDAESKVHEKDNTINELRNRINEFNAEKNGIDSVPDRNSTDRSESEDKERHYAVPSSRKLKNSVKNFWGGSEDHEEDKNKSITSNLDDRFGSDYTNASLNPSNIGYSVNTDLTTISGIKDMSLLSESDWNNLWNNTLTKQHKSIMNYIYENYNVAVPSLKAIYNISRKKLDGLIADLYVLGLIYIIDGHASVTDKYTSFMRMFDNNE